jgi:hypothetical protein
MANTPIISNISNNTLSLNQSNLIITGSQFLDLQGIGNVYIGTQSNASGTMVRQTVNSWNSGSINFSVVL